MSDKWKAHATIALPPPPPLYPSPPPPSFIILNAKRAEVRKSSFRLGQTQKRVRKGTERYGRLARCSFWFSVVSSRRNAKYGPVRVGTEGYGKVRKGTEIVVSCRPNAKSGTEEYGKVRAPSKMLVLVSVVSSRRNAKYGPVRVGTEGYGKVRKGTEIVVSCRPNGQSG